MLFLKNLSPSARAVAFIVAVAVGMTTLVACSEPAESNPTVDSDSHQSYVAASGDDGDSPTVDVDRNVYVLTGEVVGPVNSVTRQVSPAEGSIGGFAFGGAGSLSGSFFGEVNQGKGYVRLLVRSAVPESSSAKPGVVSILKVTDTKATALLPGDIVVFKCRRQYEALAAVVENQRFTAEVKDQVATWEFDYCRLATSTISLGSVK